MDAIKNDRTDNKPMWELLPLGLMEHIVNVYTYGVQKYGKPGSWKLLENGYQRYKAALFRHIVAFEKGEFIDPESHLPHLAHAAWNAIAMLYMGLKREKAKAKADAAYSRLQETRSAEDEKAYMEAMKQIETL